MNIEQFLDKMEHFSATKGAEAYQNLLIAIQIDAVVSLILSVLFLLGSLYASVNHKKLIKSIGMPSIESEAQAVGVTILIIVMFTVLTVMLLSSILTVVDGGTYTAIVNPEGFVLSKLVECSK